ncbi:MAG: hypothetical protein KDD44_07795, partial [Bdellovibrionales bacterium]|nr:hypothetical protein [Bdellovibrionales bacterium]
MVPPTIGYPISSLVSYSVCYPISRAISRNIFHMLANPMAHLVVGILAAKRFNPCTFVLTFLEACTFFVGGVLRTKGADPLTPSLAVLPSLLAGTVVRVCSTTLDELSPINLAVGGGVSIIGRC